MVRGDPGRERRRESRLIEAQTLSRVIEVVCASYEIDRFELKRRRSPHPARAPLAYLARRFTTVTYARLGADLGVSRSESVPNLTRRFAASLATDSKVRKRLRSLERELQVLHRSN
jgi:chromosomal replication initiation ATPase DnaA